ncbi:MAG: hypothetical protein H7X88_11970 [Gloeobacteraceae cyanobacterium ES-bin-316]|nr:hypothetical protein [Ferruginibacter sp.]
MESQFVFLDKEELSLPAMLDRLQIPSRQGVVMMPFFPREFTRVHFSRQSYMTDDLLRDTNIQIKVRNIWDTYRAMGRRAAPVGGDTLQKMMMQVRMATDKIKARGGKILFVRTPSSGPSLMGEQKGFPREKYWDPLLNITGSQGIHFLDYPATNHFICPEWSHLSVQDAKVYTAELARIMQTEKGWTFPASTNKE